MDLLKRFRELYSPLDGWGIVTDVIVMGGSHEASYESFESSDSIFYLLKANILSPDDIILSTAHRIFIPDNSGDSLLLPEYEVIIQALKFLGFDGSPLFPGEDPVKKAPSLEIELE